MKKIKLKIIVVLLAVFMLPVQASAANTKLYLEPASINVRAGSEVQVKVMLSSAGEKINAVGATLKYPSILKLKDWNNGNSIISFWVQNPKIENGSITFEGIIPGGYQQANGLVLTLNFEAISDGVGSISFAPSSEALLNDGVGTPAVLTLESLAVKVSKSGSNEVGQKIDDKIAPEEFTPVVARDAGLFDNKYFLVFSTQDKGSGLDYFEMSEVRSWLEPKPSNWTRAESPVILQDQDLQSWIFVKAIDKNGNERLAMLKPTNIPIYQQPVFVVFLLLLIVGIFYAKRKIFK